MQTCLCQPAKSLHRCWKNSTFVVAFLPPASPLSKTFFSFKFLQLLFLHHSFLTLLSTTLHPSPHGKQGKKIGIMGESKRGKLDVTNASTISKQELREGEPGKCWGWFRGWQRRTPSLNGARATTD